MGMFDELKDKAEKLVHDNAEKVENLSDKAIEFAGDAVDKVPGGKHSAQIDAVQNKADDAVGE